MEKVGPVCSFHRERIIRADKRNRNIQKLTPKVRAKTCWMNPMEIARRDDDNTEQLKIVSEDIENVCIRYHDWRFAIQTDVTYTRCAPDIPWTLANSLAADITLPVSVRIVPEDYAPVRYSKTRTCFRGHLLRQVHHCHRVLGNLVLSNVFANKPRRFPSRPPAVRATHPDEDIPERCGEMADVSELGAHQAGIFSERQMPALFRPACQS